MHAQSRARRNRGLFARRTARFRTYAPTGTVRWRDSPRRLHSPSMDSLLVGSLVAPAPGYRASMGTGEGAAVLLATRRGSGYLYYPATDRSYWVPLRQVAPIPSDVLPDDCRERVLSDLLLYLCAEECELHEADAGDMAVSVRIPRLSRTQLSVLLGSMGEMLGTVSFDPGSMSSVMLRLELVSLPDAAGAGR